MIAFVKQYSKLYFFKLIHTHIVTIVSGFNFCLYVTKFIDSLTTFKQSIAHK